MKEQSSSENTTQSEVNSLKSYNMIPKLHCPSFDGTNPRIWLKKCSRYFRLYGIPEDARVDLASLAMTAKAEVWVTSYLATWQHVEWVDFICDLNARFKDEKGITAVENFNKLIQDVSLEDYVDQFDES